MGKIMIHYHWKGCPPDTREQIEQVTAIFQQAAGLDLLGVYLHGSLALGCFDPRRSDLDLLVVLRKPLTLPARRAVYEGLLSLSNSPHPIEISVLQPEDLHPWRHPTPFDLHYSEDWRSRIQDDLESGLWKDWSREGQVDSDLAAHITILHHGGICLSGPAIEEVFPRVPEEDYRASLLEDADWVMDVWQKNPAYALLSLLRELAYLEERRILSKNDAVEYGAQALPGCLHSVLRQVTAMFLGEAPSSSICMEELWEALQYLKRKIDLSANCKK